MRGLVALVGRPNVGKSTLFNVMVPRARAIVHEMPGVTRDRLYGTVETPGEALSGFTLIDTGGFEMHGPQNKRLGGQLIWGQTKAAIEEADLVVLMLDLKAGLHPHDTELVRMLQKMGKPTIYVVNKVDGYEQEALASDFYRLGIDEFETISAAHNRGVRDLRDQIVEELSGAQGRLATRREVEDNTLKLALIGRPNVGKSSILNRLVGEERALVSDVAGTTRDVSDSVFLYNNRTYKILDTAGIRRRSKVGEKIETLSVIRSLQAIEDCDLALLILNATEGLTDQDARLASLAIKHHKPLIIVVNKWDLVPDKQSNTIEEWTKHLKRCFSHFGYVPVLFTSCLKNQRVHRIMSEVERIADQAAKRVKTADLNDLLQDLVRKHTPAVIKRYHKRVKFYYATQVGAMPPTFVIKCNVADEIQESYKRYLARGIRDNMGFSDIPIKIHFRDKKASDNHEQEVRA